MGRQALLVMDIQQGIVDRYGEASIGPIQAAIAAARKSDTQVIYVRVAFREGYPEVSANNRSFSAISGRGGFTESDAATQIHPLVAPEPGDIVVMKRRISAFTGSDLEVVLRGRQIDTLVLTGIATSGVVLSTLRQAADLDYQLVVLSDACVDSDEEVHRVLVEKVFPRQAQVKTVAEWAEEVAAER